MARINVDDELHAEKGFKRLVRKLGDEDRAVGMLYRFWRIAQDYWGDEMALMPREEFDAEGFDPILECGLAETRETGVYAKGAEGRFAWYLQKCRASKAGVRARMANRRESAGKPLCGAADEPAEPARSTDDTPSDNPTSSSTVTVTVTDNKRVIRASALPPLAEIWNQHCGTLPKIRGCGGTRRRQAEARWREKPDAEYWAEVIGRINRSPFCRGTNNRGWRANFDFLCRPETQHKVLEGQYDDGGGNGAYRGIAELLGEEGPP